MTKKNILALVLAAVLVGGIGAQEKEKNNAVYLGAYTVISGGGYKAGYERALNEYLSLGGFFGMIVEPGYTIADSNSGELDNLEYALQGYVRYYPVKTFLGQPFLNAGAGYSLLSLKTNAGAWLSHLCRVEAAAGWRFIIKPVFIDLYTGVTTTLGDINVPEEYGYDKNLTRVNTGLSIGFMF